MNKHILIKIMSFALYDFAIFWATYVFPGGKRIRPWRQSSRWFSEFRLCFESPIFQAMLHRLEHVIVRRGNVLYAGCGRISHSRSINVCRVTCGRALSCSNVMRDPLFILLDLP